MLPHHLATKPSDRCVVCGKETRTAHSVVGLGSVCMDCGREIVTCSSCGSEARRMTMTFLRGRALCLLCYSRERSRGAKRVSKTIDGSSLSAPQVAQQALQLAPEGYVLVALKLNQNSKTTWTAEYEREDLFMMRCS